MANIELLIKIPEEVKNRLCFGVTYTEDIQTICEAIGNNTPLVSVLDEIRAEIEHIGGDDEKAFCKNLNESYKQGLKDALKVIDKYKTESEE